MSPLFLWGLWVNKKSDEEISSLENLWAKMDSNHRRRKPADLQSAPFGLSGICPTCFFKRRDEQVISSEERKTGLKPATLSLEG